MLHFIQLINSQSWDSIHEITTCKWNAHVSEIVNFVIMTSSLFMFTLDNIRYVFVVLLLYDKMLWNSIKILIKDRFIARYLPWLSSTAAIFNHEVENWSCMNPTRVHRSWSWVHEVNGTLIHHSQTRDYEFTRSVECSISTRLLNHYYTRCTEL